MRKAGEQRIGSSVFMQGQGDRPYLAALRVVAHFATQRMRQQLMAIADAEHRHARVGNIAQPCRTAFAPVVAFGDHRPGAGDDDGGKPGRRRQRLPRLHVHRDRLVGVQAGRDPDPVWETTMTAHRGDRLPGLDDQEWRMVDDMCCHGSLGPSAAAPLRPRKS